jgi:transcriptional regulator with XRE-family HTH domain
MGSKTPTTAAEWMKHARKGLRLSMTAVAAEVGGISLRSVSRWEHGETYPSEEHRRLFVELLVRRGLVDAAAVAKGLGMRVAAPASSTDAGARASFDAAIRITADELDVPASRARVLVRDLLMRMRACGVSVETGHAWLDDATRAG